MQQAVYDALNREKRVGESFTELFRRLLDQRGGLSELIGHWDAAGQRGDRAALRALRTGGARSR